MVIVGMLIFLLSLRMRPRNRTDKLANYFNKDSNSRQSLASITMASRKSHDKAADWLDSQLVKVPETSQMALADRAWPSSRSCIEQLQQKDSKHPPIDSPSTNQIIDNLNLERLGSDSALSIDNQNWTPADGYGEGHQAAIETALSIVLTASTLVGFRAHQANHNHCCLHHAVQLTKVSDSVEF